MGPALVIGGVALATFGGVVWFFEKKPGQAVVVSDVGTDHVPTNTNPTAPPPPISSSPPQPPAPQSDAMFQVPPGGSIGRLTVEDSIFHGDHPALKNEGSIGEAEFRSNLHDNGQPIPVTPQPSLDGLPKKDLKSEADEVGVKLRKIDSVYNRKMDQLRETIIENRHLSFAEKNKRYDAASTEALKGARDEFSRIYPEVFAIFNALLIASNQKILPRDAPSGLLFGKYGTDAGVLSAEYLDRLAKQLPLGTGADERESSKKS
jgi:hypothetical protein